MHDKLIARVDQRLQRRAIGTTANAHLGPTSVFDRVAHRQAHHDRHHTHIVPTPNDHQTSSAASSVLGVGRIVCFTGLGQLVRTTWKRVLTLRMVAWSPVLVVVVIAWWAVKWWMGRRRASGEVVRHLNYGAGEQRVGRMGSVVTTSTTMPISPPIISTSGIVVLRSFDESLS